MKGNRIKINMYDDEKFYALYFGCKIEYVCVNNLCPHTCCSSYLMFSAPAWEEHIGPPILFALDPSWWYYCPTYTKKLPKWCLYLRFLYKNCVYICNFFVACSSAPVICSSLILLLFNEEYRPYFTYNATFFGMPLIAFFLGLSKWGKGKVTPLQARCGPEDG
jgi:hypothetical protein